MLLITETGELVAPQDWSVRRLCPWLDEHAFVLYAIRNCGAVAVEAGDGSVRIRWRSEGIAAPTLVAVVQWLSDQPEQKVVLSLLEGSWTHTIVPSCTEAVTILLDNHNSITRRRLRFYRKRRRLQEAPEPRFQGTLAFVQDNFGVLGATEMGVMAEKLLAGRYLLVRCAAHRLLVQKVGQGFLTIDPRWPEYGELEVEDQPDLNYGRWVAEAYREVSHTREPRLDEVDAEVEVRPGIVQRLQYSRLIVPAVDPAGNQLLLCTSEANGDINLAGRR